MDFEWSDEQELLRESVRRFLDEHAGLGFVRAQWEDPAGVTDAVWSGLRFARRGGIRSPGSPSSRG